VLLATGFSAVAVLVELQITAGDTHTLVKLHGLVGGTAQDVLVAVDTLTDLWALTIVGALVLLGLLLATWRREAVFFVVSVAGVWLLNPAFKELFQRPRPELWANNVPTSEFSFPSGHAANTAALVAALVLALPAGRWRIGAAAAGALAMVMVAFTQLALGLHYPSDVLADWLWAGAWVAGIRAVSRRAQPKTRE